MGWNSKNFLAKNVDIIRETFCYGYSNQDRRFTNSDSEKYLIKKKYLVGI